eukprot:526381-Hanusia_phi.AAC.1
MEGEERAGKGRGVERRGEEEEKRGGEEKRMRGDVFDTEFILSCRQQPCEDYVHNLPDGRWGEEGGGGRTVLRWVKDGGSM